MKRAWLAPGGLRGVTRATPLRPCCDATHASRCQTFGGRWRRLATTAGGYRRDAGGDGGVGREVPSTVDREEVARLSESKGRLAWWDPEGHMKPLHRMNPKRVAYLRACLTRRLGLDPTAPCPFAGLHFLDVGCGPGLLAEVKSPF